MVTVLAYANESLADFRQNLLKVDNSIGYGEQYITNDQLVHINNSPEKDNLTFAALKIVDDSDLFLRKIDLVSTNSHNTFYINISDFEYIAFDVN